MSTSSKPKTEVGEAVAASLTSRGLTQYGAAKFTGTSQSYVNQVVNGGRVPSGQWIDMIANVLEMPPDERVKLHRAAARTNGYKIDLT